MTLRQQSRSSAPATRRAVDREFPQRIAVRGGPGGPVHPDVAAGTGYREVVDAAVTGGGRVDRRPRCTVRRGLDLIRPAVRGLPVQGRVTDVVRLSEGGQQPLWIAERAAPSGAGVAVGGVRRTMRRVLRGRGRG